MKKFITQVYLPLNRKIDLNFTFERCAVNTIKSITEFTKSITEFAKLTTEFADEEKGLLLNRKIDLDFTSDQCAVNTIESITEFANEEKAEFVCPEEKDEFGYLRISIEYELKEYESIFSSGAIFSHPRYLSLLGIISFLIDEPLDVFAASHIQTGSFPEGIERLNLQNGNKLLIDSIDLTDFLNELIDKLRSAQDQKNLIFSLLDRWRKGRYMEKDSEDSFLYVDEATLSYFHVLELLGDVYAKQLTKKFEDLIKKFSDTFNSDILSLTGQALKDGNSAKLKLLSNILIPNKNIPVAAKISFLLKDLNLYDNQTAFWIKNLIEARNSAAHGRHVHYDQAVFPLQPFFPLIRDSLYTLEFLRILTAKIISSHLGISLFDKKWNEISKYLIQDDLQTKDFLKTENFQAIDDLSEEGRKIVLGGLNHHILSKKIKTSDCKKLYEFYLDTEIENESFLSSNVGAMILLYEVVDEQVIENKLKTAIVNIHRLNCNPYSRFRDTRDFLNFHNFDSPKLEALLINKIIR